LNSRPTMFRDMLNNICNTIKCATDLFYRFCPSLAHSVLMMTIIMSMHYLYDPEVARGINEYLFYPTTEIYEIDMRLRVDGDLVMHGRESEVPLIINALKSHHKILNSQFDAQCVQVYKLIFCYVVGVLIGYPIYRLFKDQPRHVISSYIVFFGACGLFVWQNVKQQVKDWSFANRITRDLLPAFVHNFIWRDIVYPIFRGVIWNTTTTIMDGFVHMVQTSRFIWATFMCVFIAVLFVKLVYYYKTRFAAFRNSYIQHELDVVDTMETEAVEVEAEAEAEAEEAEAEADAE
jgi:hypothetical protein